MAKVPSQKTSEQQAQVRIGAKLRQKRREAGLTLQDVSTQTGIHISTLSRLEAGIYVLSVPRLLTLTKIIHCDEREFLDDASSPEAGQ